MAFDRLKLSGTGLELPPTATKPFWSTIQETVALPAGSEINGVRMYAAAAEFPNGSWKNMHPPNSGANTAHC